jgi:hypothetical protein
LEIVEPKFVPAIEMFLSEADVLGLNEKIVGTPEGGGITVSVVLELVAES